MLFFSACMMLVLFSSCGKEVKQTKGLVKEISPTNLVLVVDGDDELNMDILDNVRYPNGAVMVNDTVIVTYVSSYKENQAAVIQLVPRTGNEMTIGHDDSKELMTASDTIQVGDSIQWLSS